MTATRGPRSGTHFIPARSSASCARSPRWLLPRCLPAAASAKLGYTRIGVMYRLSYRVLTMSGNNGNSASEQYAQVKRDIDSRFPAGRFVAIERGQPVADADSH